MFVVVRDDVAQLVRASDCSHKIASLPLEKSLKADFLTGILFGGKNWAYRAVVS